MTCLKSTNALISFLFVLVLFSVSGILIFVTEENLDGLFERPKIMMQSSLDNINDIMAKFGNKEENCDLEVRLGEKGEFDVFPFVSFSGSGNT